MILPITITALKYLLVQKMDSMVTIYSYRVKMKKFIPITVLLCWRRTTNSVRDINMMKSILLNIEQDLNNPVEILKYIQEKLVQGEPLERVDASQCVDVEANS